jgi:2-polyprenyl-3-methyl-5-hydroxy-6-metoxy-1,4-benzoquinol methylase
MKDTDTYTKATLESWNEAAPIHMEINSGLINSVQNPEFNHLTQGVMKILDKVSVTGKSCVQICCNNGIDLISLRKIGASHCLGIDGAEEFIKQAKLLADKANVDNIDFVTHNVYSIPETFSGRFDIGLITIGVLSWMPDLEGFFSAAAKLLKPGGHLIIEDLHPVLFMYEEGDPSYLNASYFEKEPFKEEDGLDYFTGKKYKAKPNYSFQHTFSEILMSTINAGLVLRSMEETPQNIGNFCADLEHTTCNPPLAFFAHWQKENIPNA